MDLKLRVWRQAGTNAPGAFEDIDATGISPEMSFLEMFDVVNDRLVADGGEPMAPTLHKEELVYENVHFQTRSYK